MTDPIDALLRELTLDEKAALTAGADMWHTVAVERLGIPAFGLTDGPNGARGLSFDRMTPSVCVPCGSALGATWDVDLMRQVGEVIGHQARAKQARVLLAPTINLHRSPLGGRTFEAYSEDPLLTGKLAAAFVQGVQSQGVIATPKHFVANEAEFERNTIDSIVDERTLRELYLLPFELAVREGGALSVMGAYNRVNGTWCCEHAELMRILRDEWGFEGFFMTDWFAVTSTVDGARAGCDLEMPGPGRQLGSAVAGAVRRGELDEAFVDDIVGRLLSAFARVGALDDPPIGDEQTVDLPEHRAIARRAATQSAVLLRNEGVLPLDASTITSLAVIGPNATRAQIIGGGSATLEPHYRVTPLEALQRRLGDRIALTYEPGCNIDRTVPPVTMDTVEVFVDVDGNELARRPGDGTKLMFFGPPIPGLPERWSVRSTGMYASDVDGPHEITLVQSGRARVLVDGEVVLDGVANPPPPGDALFGTGSVQIETAVDFVAGKPVELTIELSNESAPMICAALVGVRPKPPADLLDRAAAAAAAADAAIVIVGTNDDWETEGHDRETLGLPGEQNELVWRVCRAQPRTVVVVNAGSPVALPWGGDAKAILDIWFGGQEMSDGLVDVLFGDADPGGRLATTFPQRIEHTPAFGNFPGEAGEVRYGEGVLMGYRWYEARKLPVQFPFGHGLSYTTFEIGAPVLEGDVVRVPVANTGERAGSEVVQLYVEPVAPSVVRPPKELKAFAKVHLDPGASTVVELTLDDRSFAYWQPDLTEYARVRARQSSTTGFTMGAPPEDPPGGWRVEPGEYRLHIGRSSADIAHVLTLTRP